MNQQIQIISKTIIFEWNIFEYCNSEPTRLLSLGFHFSEPKTKGLKRE